MKTNDTDHLKHWIRDAVETVSPDVLSRMLQKLEYQMDACKVDIKLAYQHR